MRKIQVGLLGLGTVGMGVYKLLRKRAETMDKTIGAQLEIKKILVHNKNKKREGVDETLLTDDWKEIIEDDEIQIVIEVIGGIEPAKTMILEALKAGKNVVSANKDLIAEEGKEIFDTAQAAGKDFLFEAAVAGGIPIIRPLKQCLAGNDLTDILGIVNGTTNYILTKMFEDGMEFLVEVGTSNFISLPRWYIVGQNGTALIRDWKSGAEIVCASGTDEYDVVPVHTASGITKTMAPRREENIHKTEIPVVESSIYDFYRNVAAAIDGTEEPAVKLPEVMRVMKLMEAVKQSADTHEIIRFE